MCTSPSRPRQSGIGLLDLILAIVVISIALTAVVSIFVVTSKGSVDPMLRQQAQLVAEAYLEEILLKRFKDPTTNSVCPAREASRVLYDNVCDYDNIGASGTGEAPTDQFGNALAQLSSYWVTVHVETSALSLGTAANSLDNSVVNKVLRVDVTVKYPNSTGAVLAALSGYRTSYNCNTTGDPAC